MNSKNVIIFGLINVILQSLIPIVSLPEVSWYNFVLPFVSTVLIFLSKNMNGKGWTVSGQIGATIASFAVTHPTPDGITFKYVLAAWLLPVLIQVVGALMPTPIAKAPEENIEK
jgi:hypothetical protein